jgi:hypothetical protein
MPAVSNFFPSQPPFLDGKGSGITSWHIHGENYFG